MNVLVLTSEGCKPCSRVKRVLEELAKELPSLTVNMIDITSPEGSRLALESNVLYPPAVFIEGQLFAKGKVDAESMIATIRKRGP